ncbi:MAG: domain S-box protein [Chitinophagaceae bacterium]|jgi:PAS domain S-box-containing protein|nr:domain S-box protein [Chitinophagaceae bacterium]
MTNSSTVNHSSSLLAFQQAVDLNLLMSVTDKNGVFKSVNKNLCEASGYSEAELIGESFRILSTADDDGFFEKMWQSLLTAGGWKGEARHKAKDGSIFWLDKVIVPIWDESSEIRELLSIGTLITDHKEAEFALLRNKERSDALFNAIPEMISLSTPEGKRSYVNRIFCDFFGKTAEELKDRNYSFADEKSIREYIDQLKALTPNNPSITNLHLIENAHGERRWILWSETGIFDAEGKLTEILSLGKDVTRMKEAQEEIVSQKRFTEGILNNIPADIAVFDDQHRYVFVNQKGLTNEGMRNWLIGKTDFDYCELKNLDKKQAEKRRAFFNKAVTTGEQIEWVDEHETSNGEKKYILRKFYPYKEDERIRYVIGYGIDVTSIKRADEQKDEYIKQLEEIAFTTSHKVRHPLVNIQGLLPMLEDESLSTDDRRKVLQYMKDCTILLDEFTRELSKNLLYYKQQLTPQR